ncbi:HK97 family phage prohead protease [Ancylobacter dichloromethanicus]
MTRYAPLAPAGPSTFDPQTRSMRAVVAAGAEVERYDARGRYVEVLDHRGIVIPPGGSVPLLNAHRRSDLGDVLGSATDIAAKGATVEATLTLSSRDDVAPIAADIAAGHIRGVSVGYRVLARTETTDAAGGRRVTATRWEIAEVSLVPIPADPRATIREAPMTTPTEPTPNPAPAPAVVNPPPADTATRASINLEIRSIAAVAGLDQGWIDSQVDANATAEAARAAAFEAMRARTAPAGTIRTATVVHDHGDPIAIRAAMSDALAHRMAPSLCKLEGRAAEFRGFRVLDMIGDLAQARGERINLRDQAALMERAVGAHSTSDFPLLLADAANKALLANYEVAAPTYRLWAARRTFSDFKDTSFLRVGDFPRFEETNEKRRGEVRHAVREP